MHSNEAGSPVAAAAAISTDDARRERGEGKKRREGDCRFFVSSVLARACAEGFLHWLLELRLVVEICPLGAINLFMSKMSKPKVKKIHTFKT